MNREVLSRGKRKDNGEWFEGIYIPEVRAIVSSFCVCGYNSEADVMDCQAVVRKVSPETVGTFTGLNDANGTRIFEGDIVKYTYYSRDGDKEEYLCVVVNRAGAFGIEYGAHYHKSIWTTFEVDFGEKCDNFISFWEIIWNSDNSDCLVESYVDCVEVIGNIHDNPELLKGGVENE